MLKIAFLIFFNILLTNQQSIADNDNNEIADKITAKAGDSFQFVADNGKVFSIEVTRANWYEALQGCAYKGLTLASIESQVENIGLQQFFLDNGLTSVSENFWLSGTDFGVPRGRFYWLATGRLVTYRNFGIGEPNNYGGSENCISVSGSGLWNDYNCIIALPYICQERT